MYHTSFPCKCTVWWFFLGKCIVGWEIVTRVQFCSNSIIPQSFPFLVYSKPYSQPYPQVTRNLLSVSIVLPFLETVFKWNNTICVICVWLPSLNKIFSRFIYGIACIKVCCFLLLNNIPSYAFNIFCLLIQQLMYIWIDLSAWLFWIMLL